MLLKKLKHSLHNRYLAFCAGLSAAAMTGPALAAVPAPPTPSTTPANNDAISWFEGVFEDSSEVGILVVGVVLFIIGAIGMIWAVTQVLTNKGTIGDVAKIGLASAAGIAFGTYLLTQASTIIT
ncbi:hypothetical protein [Thiolapillus sp.]|uniref:hypothetical protein n=1 Tax=Thiolapillus sp. TaxID=2017437 RepID=UPI003AF60FA6